MEETRGITVKVAESLHTKAKQEAETNSQTMSQFIEAVLRFYFSREEEKDMNTNKRTLAFQVSEEFFNEVQEYIKARKMKLKDFGITAMRRMLEDADPATTEAPAAPESEDASPADSETPAAPETEDEDPADPEADTPPEQE